MALPDFVAMATEEAMATEQSVIIDALKVATPSIARGRGGGT